MAKVALRLGCAKQSKNLKRDLLCNVFIRGAIKEFFGFEATLFIVIEQGNRIKS